MGLWSALRGRHAERHSRAVQHHVGRAGRGAGGARRSRLGPQVPHRECAHPRLVRRRDILARQQGPARHTVGGELRARRLSEGRAAHRRGGERVAHGARHPRALAARHRPQA